MKTLILSVFADDKISHFTHEINNWVEGQGKESEEFQQLIHSLALPSSLQLDDWRSFVGEQSNIVCVICQSILNSFMEYRRQGVSAEEIRSQVIQLCIKLNLQTERVCHNVVTINLVSKLNCYANKILNIFIFNIIYLLSS